VGVSFRQVALRLRRARLLEGVRSDNGPSRRLGRMGNRYVLAGSMVFEHRTTLVVSWYLNTEPGVMTRKPRVAMPRDPMSELGAMIRKPRVAMPRDPRTAMTRKP